MTWYFLMYVILCLCCDCDSDEGSGAYQCEVLLLLQGWRHAGLSKRVNCGMHAVLTGHWGRYRPVGDIRGQPTLWKSPDELPLPASVHSYLVLPTVHSRRCQLNAMVMPWLSILLYGRY